MKYFVLSSQYRELADSILDRYVRIARMLNYTMLLTLAAGAILMFTGVFG